MFHKKNFEKIINILLSNGYHLNIIFYHIRKRIIINFIQKIILLIQKKTQ